jgi:lincosamide nucleotidyltransferase B/F
MFLQQTMLDRLRQCCHEDERVVAALLYGSFTTGEGDAFSDIECALFFADDQLATLDKQAWLAQIAPVALCFADDFGHHTAIFTNLIRGEFHFEPATKIASVATWRGNAWFPDAEAAILVDRTGELRRQIQPLLEPPERETPEGVLRLIHNQVNLLLFGANVLERGEWARALEILSLGHRYLLWLARLNEQATRHWPTPSRRAEADLSPESYARFARCTAALDPGQLVMAYVNAALWTQELAATLARRHGLTWPAPLLDQITERFRRLAER